MTKSIVPNKIETSGHPQASRRRERLLTYLPVLAALLTVAPIVNGQFVLDDRAAIANHPVVNGNAPLSDIACYDVVGRPLKRCAGASKTSVTGGIIRPLETAFLRLQWRLFSGSPIAFHLVLSIALALLILEITSFLRRLGFGPELAAATSALFAVLTIHVDATASIHNGATVLVLLLSIIGLRSLFGRHSWIAPIALLIAFGFKESAVLFVPTATWMAFFFPRARRYRVLASLWVLLAAILILRSSFIPMDPSGWTIAADNILMGLPLIGRAAASVGLFGRYIAMTFWPSHLAFDYSYSAITTHTTTNIYFFIGSSSALVLATLVFMGIRRRASKAWALTGFLAGAVGAQGLFVSHLITPLTIIFAERLFFPGSLWLVALVLFGGWSIATRHPRYRLPLQTTFTAMLLIQLALSMLRATEWSTPTLLYRSQIASQPASIKGQLYWAKELERMNRPVAALWHFSVAIEGKRHFPRSWKPPPRPERTADIFAAIPRMLAPKTAPWKVWKKLSVLVRKTLGSNSAEVAKRLGAVPKPPQ